MRIFFLAMASLFSLAACGGGPAGAQGEPARSPETSAPETIETDTTRFSEMKGMKLYDAQGKEQACAKPDPSCASSEPNTDFKERCALAGFRTMQCGCDLLCTGNIASKAKQSYDQSGNAKACEPATADCTPPQASSAFQDACTEKGYRLQVCGCEWLCSGNYAK